VGGGEWEGMMIGALAFGGGVVWAHRESKLIL
jgi:hypothetical protein